MPHLAVHTVYGGHAGMGAQKITRPILFLDSTLPEIYLNTRTCESGEDDYENDTDFSKLPKAGT